MPSSSSSLSSSSAFSSASLCSSLTLIALLLPSFAALYADVDLREVKPGDDDDGKIVFQDSGDVSIESSPPEDSTADYVPKRYIRQTPIAPMSYLPTAPISYPAFAIPVVSQPQVSTDQLKNTVDEGVSRVKDMESKLSSVNESVSDTLKSVNESVNDKLKSVDESVADKLKSTREAVEGKIEGVSGRLSESLTNVSRDVESRMNDSMQRLDSRLDERIQRQMQIMDERLNVVTNAIRNRSDETRDVATQALGNVTSEQDSVREMLVNSSSLYYDNMRELLNESCDATSHDEMLRRLDVENSALEALSNATENFRRHVDERLDELQRDQECTLDKLLAKPVNESTIMSRLNCSRVVSHEEKKTRDVDLLNNLELKIMVADESDPSKSKTVGLTPLVLARRIRGISNGMKNKGMVSVCYHNQPTAFTNDHPLAPNDSEAVRKMFNGTMDAAHSPRKGVNLDSPNYINALILELKNLQRDYVSLCVESSEADEEYENAAKCLNMIVKRKA